MTPEILPRAAFLQSYSVLVSLRHRDGFLFRTHLGTIRSPAKTGGRDIPQKTLEVKQECLTQKS